MEPDREAIFESVKLWRQRIGEASGKWGGCDICAVTKTHGADTINLAYEAGIRTIGENRVQELLGKLENLNPGFDIHLIGALQTNKVRQVLSHVSMIESLDRESLAREISRRAGEAGITARVLIEVGIAGEAQKSGVAEEGLLPLLELCGHLPNLQVRGLMAVMPVAEDPEDVRVYFRRMRQWFDRLREDPPKTEYDNIRMEVLSMGMTHDCIVAAQEGATTVRLGRALFGERSYPGTAGL